jgi:hypothetical protein
MTGWQFTENVYFSTIAITSINHAGYKIENESLSIKMN